MKRRHFGLLLIVFAVAAAWQLGWANASSAQTSAPRTAPTPTPTPFATPRPSPTPNVIDDDEPIKVETELVNLNVRVVDRNNRSINDVPQKDFRIFEDGVAQQIEFFSRAEVPTNYALLLDGSGSMRSQIEKVIEAGKIFVASNRPADETAIIRFISSDKITIEQNFTSNKADLEDALENLVVEGGQTAVIDAVYLAVDNVEQYEKSKNPDDRKRRAVILVSDGEDRDSYYTEKQLVELLRESETQIYVIGFINELSKEGGMISRSPQAKAKAFLDRLAAESGGKAYYPSSANELPQIAREISSEMRSQYSIGYIPTNDARDGSFRNIKVQIADGPNGQKRIAVTRAGRTADGSKPSLRDNRDVNTRPKN
ncbi:MAG: VWA domain-containing protein [Acidobacteria bacterium]|nr:VWA domain-containing protein [Acidobacteriota bacterium]MCW5950448.1 VWA domain-containing protein [Pyrinomonadaceae bacterium]